MPIPFASTSSSRPSGSSGVESGEPPRLFGVEPPKPRIQAVWIVDMSRSNAWAGFAGMDVEAIFALDAAVFEAEGLLHPRFLR
jgi:hypothetical protein